MVATGHQLPPTTTPAPRPPGPRPPVQADLARLSRTAPWTALLLSALNGCRPSPLPSPFRTPADRWTTRPPDESGGPEPPGRGTGAHATVAIPSHPHGTISSADAEIPSRQPTSGTPRKTGARASTRDPVHYPVCCEPSEGSEVLAVWATTSPRDGRPHRRLGVRDHSPTAPPSTARRTQTDSRGPRRVPLAAAMTAAIRTRSRCCRDPVKVVPHGLRPGSEVSTPTGQPRRAISRLTSPVPSCRTSGRSPCRVLPHRHSEPPEARHVSHLSHRPRRARRHIERRDGHRQVHRRDGCRFSRYRTGAPSWVDGAQAQAQAAALSAARSSPGAPSTTCSAGRPTAT